MTSPIPESLILVVDDYDKAPHLKPRHLKASRLVAVKLPTKGRPQFALIKSDRLPNNRFVSSHFSDPISLATLNRYIGANLS